MNEKRKEAKGKVEKERYTHFNAGFQRTARRDKKAFLSDKCLLSRETAPTQPRDHSVSAA